MSQSRTLRPCDDILTLIGDKVSALRDKAYHEDRITFKGAWWYQPWQSNYITPIPQEVVDDVGDDRPPTWVYRGSITLRLPEDEYKKLNWSCGRVSWAEQQHRSIISELNSLYFLTDHTRLWLRRGYLRPSEIPDLIRVTSSSDSDDY